ncbi:MAG TPA: tripartite tricarboxylate transporter substrate binding protein [Burkholderiaceae bacterium]|nr:tripartite tricarboxylate transporter substrate binding protein [Burkholderiaceae bacterium]
MRRIHDLMRCVAILLIGVTSAAVSAQEWPTRPIRMIVPFPAGGTMDVLAREIGHHIERTLGQNFIVENKPGAGTVIGVDAAARSTDRHTFVMVANSFTVNPTLQKSLPYDTLKDLQPVALVARTANVLAVHPGVPAKTVQELVSYAQKNPTALSYASFGNGTTAHFAAEMLKLRTGIQMVHVPYKGQVPGLNDLIGGRVQVMFGNLPEFIPQIEAGKIRALGTTYLDRTRFTPHIPTVAEQGLPGFETDSWYGVLAPATTPPAVAEKLNAAINTALDSPEIKQSLTKRHLDPLGGSRQHFGKFIRSEIDKYAKIVREANITVD